MQEKEMDFLEEKIPELAEIAFKQAYWQALASGQKVLIAENGELLEISPDGSQKVIKKIPTRKTIQSGLKIQRK